jgi:fatty-acyl-CoA synthase
MCWREVIEEARRRAHWLVRTAVDEPPHLGLLLPNGIEYLTWLFACALAGWTVVGLNPTRRGEALARDVRSTDCQLVIADDVALALLEGLELELAHDRLLSVDAVASLAAPMPTEPLPLPADETLLLLLFTSGTTGQPKAVRCTQGRLASIAEAVVPAYGFSATDVCYCPMPLFHGNALMALVAPAVLVGATIALPPRFSAGQFLTDVRTFSATMFTYVGKAIAYLLATDPTDDDRSTTLVRGFGTEASAADRLRFEARFGCVLIEGYGSSEGGVNIIATPDTPPGALGPAAPGADIVVVDPDSGIEMARAVFDEHGTLRNGSDAIGEIVNRSGVGKFEGYYGAPEAEADRTRTGWYWTGDLGYRDEAGYFWFAGRGGDWLRVDSENLAATPIEAVLSRYRPFGGVAVFAVPDPGGGTGDAVMAAVEMRLGFTFEPNDFVEWMASQPDLGTKWPPTFVRVCGKLDETATGKITKVRLRHEAWHGTDPVWFRPSRSDAFVLLGQADTDALDNKVAHATRPPA